MKKLLATILALVMALSLCTAAWAETTADCTGSCEHEAAIDSTHYDTLQEAFDAVKTGETVTLLKSITLNNSVTCLVNGITLNGNGKTITCATATKDTLNTTGKTAISFGGKNAAGTVVWCTGVTVQNLKMEGMARFALYFHGGTVSRLENVNISGNYWYAINLFGTHGATMVGCNISNSADLGNANEGGASIWSNVSSSNPLILQNSDVGIIGINKYTTDNTLAPKIKIEQGAKAQIRTYDDGVVSQNKALCIYPESAGTYSIYEQVDGSSTWTEIEDAYVAQTANGNKYISLVGAVAAAGNNGTIKLLKDADLGTQTIDNLTVDLNGYKLGVEQVTITGMLSVKNDTGEGRVTGIGGDNTANKIKAASGYEAEWVDGVIVVKKTTSNSYSYSPTIYAVKTAADAKSATDYSGGIYGLTFIYTVNYSSFTGVQVDGKTLAKGNYIAEANGINTEIYLKAVYLQTLAAGKHTITGLSPAGNASTEFTIGGKTTAPQTFDAGIGVYAVTAVLSITGMAWTAKKRH